MHIYVIHSERRQMYCGLDGLDWILLRKLVKDRCSTVDAPWMQHCGLGWDGLGKDGSPGVDKYRARRDVQTRFLEPPF